LDIHGISNPRRQAAVDAAHAEVFDFEEFLMPYFAPQLRVDAASLNAAERRDLGRDEVFVDAGDAAFEPLRDALDTSDLHTGACEAAQVKVRVN
jgi:hypothetical protein